MFSLQPKSALGAPLARSANVTNTEAVSYNCTCTYTGLTYLRVWQQVTSSNAHPISANVAYRGIPAAGPITASITYNGAVCYNFKYTCNSDLIEKCVHSYLVMVLSQPALPILQMGQ